MRLAVISDIHGNLPALEAVVARLAAEAPDAYVCAGDIVGYGAFPNQCIELLSKQPGLVCVAGNHDLIALGRLGDEGAIRLARETLAWTRTVLTETSRTFLASLPLSATASGALVAHGSPTDPEKYVRDAAEIAFELERLRREQPEVPLLILGHTHRAGAWRPSGAQLRPARDGTLTLPPDGPLLVNPGSVGQSRGFRVRATCALLDTEQRAARFYDVGYDVARCRAELVRVGLPPNTYHLPVWRTSRRLARARRVYRRLFIGRR